MPSTSSVISRTVPGFFVMRRLDSRISDVFQVRAVRFGFQARLAEYNWGGTHFGPWFYGVGPEQAIITAHAFT